MKQQKPTNPNEALAAMLDRITPVPTEVIDLVDSGGRILAQELHADRPSPACDVSAMDGYAVRLGDVVEGSLAVAGEVLIGVAPPVMPESAALAIVTGAPAPDGADAVIKREDVTESPGRIEIGAEVVRTIKAGMNIRRCGENMSEGKKVAPMASLVTPALAGALATFGVERPQVFRRVRVGIVITGDEVLAPSLAPTSWQLRDSHSSVLRTMFGSCAWLDPFESVRAPDDESTILDAAQHLLNSCDALVLTGGVSMGDHDHVPSVVQKLGAQVVFHRLSQRPGRPALGAIAGGGIPIFGLPGNPLSVLVTARRLALPALARRAGLRELPPPTMVRLTNPDQRTIDLWWNRLIRRTGTGTGELLSSRGSADVPSSAMSDGFVEIPPGESGEGPWAFYGWSN